MRPSSKACKAGVLPREGCKPRLLLPQPATLHCYPFPTPAMLRAWLLHLSRRCQEQAGHVFPRAECVVMQPGLPLVARRYHQGCLHLLLAGSETRPAQQSSWVMPCCPPMEQQGCLLQPVLAMAGECQALSAQAGACMQLDHTAPLLGQLTQGWPAQTAVPQRQLHLAQTDKHLPTHPSPSNKLLPKQQSLTANHRISRQAAAAAAALLKIFKTSAPAIP